MQQLNKKNRVKAFTLSEMLVVLLLTVIVVGLAFSILNLVQKQMNGIQEGYEIKTVNNQLKQGLWIDFNSHGQIQWDSKEQLLLMQNEIGQTSYRFYENFVLKGKDTLHTDIRVNALYFKGNLVDKGDVDALELVSSDQGNEMLFIFKNNAASDSMK